MRTEGYIDRIDKKAIEQDNHMFYVDKIFLFSVIIVLMIISITEVSAWSNTTFNNSLTSENLTFTGSQNITRYLSVPQDIYLTNAFMNLSGLNSTNYSSLNLYNITTICSGSCSGVGVSGVYVNNTDRILLFGSTLKFYNITDGNYKNITMPTLPAGSDYLGFTLNQSAIMLINETSIIVSNYSGSLVRNYTLNSTNANGGRGIFYDGTNYYISDTGSSVYGLWKYSNTGTYQSAYNTDSISTGFRGIYGNGTALYIAAQQADDKVYVLNYTGSLLDTIDIPNGSPFGLFWNTTETYIGYATTQLYQLTSNSRITNLIGYVDTDSFYSYQQNFTIQNNRTANFASAINSYLISCSYSGGYCQVPIIFHSETAGILRYSNNLFDNVGMTENNISYTNTTYETSSQNISLNFSLGTATNNLYTTANIVYNGTSYVGEVICDGISCIANRTLDIPLVNSNQNNFTFYWEVTTFDGITSYITNSSTKTQIVNAINLTSCSSGNLALNFTFYNESDLVRINSVDFAATFNYYLGSGNIFKNLSYNGVGVNESSFCVSPSNQQFKTDSIISYGKSGYVTRPAYLDNHIINTTVQLVDLFLLPSTDSTTFIVEVLDQVLSKIAGAYVYVQRYYPSTNQYETVQILQTDENGETVGFYEIETVDYRHIIIKDGEILLTTEKQKIFPKEVPYTLRFLTGEQINYPWESFEKNQSITSGITFNKTSNVVTFTYIDVGGSIDLAELIIKRLSTSNSSETIICSQNSTQSTGTLTCDMGNYSGSFIAYGLLDDDITDVYPFTITTAYDIFGREGLFIGMFIVMVAGFAFIWNPTAGIIGINVALIFVNMIGFITVSPIFIFGSIAVSIIAIILLKT